MSQLARALCPEPWDPLPPDWQALVDRWEPRAVEWGTEDQVADILYSIMDLDRVAYARAVAAYIAVGGKP